MALAPAWSVVQERIKEDFLPVLAIELLTEYQPFLFREDMPQFDGFKAECTGSLQLKGPTEIMVVGSGHTGYSLSPDNFGAPFTDQSDIDVAIVSPETFDSITGALLTWRYPWHMRKESSEPSRQRLQVLLENAFAGFVDPHDLKYVHLGTTKMIPSTQSFSFNWFRALTQIKTPLLAKRDVTARLYRTRWHLEQYQVHGLALIRKSLELAEGSHEIQ